MNERPILFSGAMVRAILEGRKTQTRRVVKPQPPSLEQVLAISGSGYSWMPPEPRIPYWRVAGPVWAARQLMGTEPTLRCPFGVPGDRLWVKETFTSLHHNGVRWVYRADGEDPRNGWDDVPPDRRPPMKWHASIYMPRRLSRITLAVSAVRIERLQAITEDDARAEGARSIFETIPHVAPEQPMTSGERVDASPVRAGFACLWDEINDHKATWKSNPWVWVVTFARIASKEAAA